MAAAAQAIRSGLQVMLPLDTSIVQLPNAKLLVSLLPTSASNPSTIISPVQQRLPLTRPAKRIARLAVHLDLIDVTTKRLPAFDLTPGLHQEFAVPYSIGNTTGTIHVDHPDEASLWHAIPRADGWH